MSRNETVYVNVGSGNNVEPQASEPATANLSIKLPKERYSGVLCGIGIAEFIIGLLSFILGIVTLGIASANEEVPDASIYSYLSPDSRYYDHTLTYIAQGIWCGVFAMVVGILGARSRSNPSKRLYNANIVFSIIGANMMGSLTVLSSIAAVSYRIVDIRGLYIVHSLLALFGFTGGVIMIVHAACCCVGIWHKNEPHQGVAVSYYPTSTGMQQPQLIQLSNGQYALVPAKPIVASNSIGQVVAVGGPAASHQSAQMVPTSNPRQTAQAANPIPPGYNEGH